MMSPCKPAGLTARPFYALDLRFNDGGDGTNNTVSISNLSFGMGTALESTTNFLLVDAYPDTQDIDFQPGTTITFRLIFTANANVNAAQPDSIFVSLFDDTGNPFNTQTGGPILEIDEPTVAGTVPNAPQIFTFGGLTVSVVPVPASGVPLVAKDFNVDGQADLIWENTVTGQRGIWILKNGGVASAINLPTIPTQWRITGSADFLGNGQADLVWENTVTGQRGIWILENGGLASIINLPTIPTQWHIAAAADFLGTLQAGLVWENTVTGERGIWILENGGLVSIINLPTIPTQWRIAGAADFLGTGQAGLVWENTVTGQHGIWILKDGGLASIINLPTIPTQWRIAGAADFLGTGQAGLVWENTVTGQRGIWILENGGLVSIINLPTIPIQWHIAEH